MRLRLSLPEGPASTRLGALLRARFPGRTSPEHLLPNPENIGADAWVDEAWWRSGPLVVRARSNVHGALSELAEVLGDLSSPTNESTDPIDLTVIPSEAGGDRAIVVHLGSELVASGSTMAEVGRVTMLRLARLAIDRQPTAVHLHAALATSGGTVALIVGPRRSGKSTLVAAAGARGWAVHTDEQVALTLATGGLTGFPRPVALRSDVLDRLGALPDRPVPSLVPLTLLGRPAGPDELQATVLVLPVVDHHGPSTVPIDPAAAFMTLLSETLDADRHGAEGDAALADLAASVPAVGLRFGEPGSGVDLLEQVVRHPRDDIVVERLAGDPGGDPTALGGGFDDAGSVLLQRGAATGYGFGSGGVIVGSRSRALVEVDQVGFEVWRRMDGGTPLATIASELAADPSAVIGFAAALIDLNLLTSA